MSTQRRTANKENRGQIALHPDELEGVTGGLALQRYQEKLDKMVGLFNSTNFSGMNERMKQDHYDTLMKYVNTLKEHCYEEHHVVLEPTVPIKDIFG